jgi:hypothetical protein
VATIREGEFLESVLPVQAFAHLTTLHDVSQYALGFAFRRWIDMVQRHHRLTLGWIQTMELQPATHIHAAIVAAAPLDCDIAARMWREQVAPNYCDAAQVKSFERGLCGLAYVMKELGNDSDAIRFSENITAFVQTNDRVTIPANRQWRRIQAQIRCHQTSI